MRAHIGARTQGRRAETHASAGPHRYSLRTATETAQQVVKVEADARAREVQVCRQVGDIDAVESAGQGVQKALYGNQDPKVAAMQASRVTWNSR